MKDLNRGLALALMALACTAAIAQETKSKTKETPAQKRTDRAEARAESRADRAEAGTRLMDADKGISEYFAGKLMLMDQSTIQLARLAEERSSDEKVKQFAKALIAAHMGCSEKLRKSAPGVVGVTQLSSGVITRETGFRGTTDTNDDARIHTAPADDQVPVRNPSDPDQLTESLFSDKGRAEGDARAQTTTDLTPLHQILAIERQATENYIQSTTEMLTEYQGQDFDMGFLGFTIGSHTWALAELKAMDSVGDEKFQKLIRDATTGVEQHLKMAEELSKELGADSAQRGSTARPEPSEQNAPAPKP